MQAFLLASIPPMQRERRVRLWLWGSAALLFLGLFVFMNLGRWLVTEDPLRKADAIAVLSGRMPGRALEAARVYKQGYAPKVWLTRSSEPAAALAKLSIPYVGEDAYDKQILLHEGVSENAIVVLDPPIVNTADEMKAIGEELHKENGHAVILVTSKVHTRRAKTLWTRISALHGEAIVRGVSDDSFDPARWWKSTADALDVVREVLGLLNAWAGLPLQPAA